MSSYELFNLADPADRAKPAKIERERAERITTGQQLYARIKKSSKYFGQGQKGALFAVAVEADHPDAYLVQGGPDGQYRLADVNIFVVDQTGRETRIC